MSSLFYYSFNTSKITSKFSRIVFFILLSIIFFLSPLKIFAQAPMTVFGIASNDSTIVKILINDQYCKDAKILNEANSSTGYIFLAYIDEGECSAFVNSQIGFTVDGKKASETMIWRKGGAPTNPIGLTLTINGNTPGNLNSDSDSIGNTKDKKIVPELPGPALRVTPEIAKIEKKENTVVVKESKKSEDMIIVVPSENKDTLSIDSDKNNLNEKSTSNNSSSQQKIEEKIMLEDSSSNSNNKIIILALGFTLLVLFGFYSLASKK